jgi:hypothetical protein
VRKSFPEAYPSPKSPSPFLFSGSEPRRPRLPNAGLGGKNTTVRHAQVSIEHFIDEYDIDYSRTTVLNPC